MLLFYLLIQMICYEQTIHDRVPCYQHFEKRVKQASSETCECLKKNSFESCQFYFYHQFGLADSIRLECMKLYDHVDSFDRLKAMDTISWPAYDTLDIPEVIYNALLIDPLLQRSIQLDLLFMKATMMNLFDLKSILKIGDVCDIPVEKIQNIMGIGLYKELECETMNTMKELKLKYPDYLNYRTNQRLEIQKKIKEKYFPNFENEMFDILKNRKK